jgi:hypothetical protein
MSVAEPEGMFVGQKRKRKQQKNKEPKPSMHELHLQFLVAEMRYCNAKRTLAYDGPRLTEEERITLQNTAIEERQIMDELQRQARPKPIPHCRVCHKPCAGNDHTECKAKRQAKVKLFSRV